jgi:hypothetical protein
LVLAVLPHLVMAQILYFHLSRLQAVVVVVFNLAV